MKKLFWLLFPIVAFHYSYSQYIYLGKGRWTRSHERVQNFARGEIEKKIKFGLILTKRKAFVWNANSIEEFNRSGLDTIEHFDLDELLTKYVLQEASKKGLGKKKVSFWYCGKRVSWNGKLSKDGDFDGRIIILPVVPSLLCGCYPASKKFKSKGFGELINFNCPTNRTLFALDTILSGVAPYLYNQLGSAPPSLIDKGYLWTLSVNIKKMELPKRIQILRYNLKTFKCDTIPVDLPEEERFTLNEDLSASPTLLSRIDSTIVFSFGNRLVYVKIDQDKNAVTEKRVIYLPGSVNEMKLISKDTLALFSFFDSDKSGALGIGYPEIKLINLKTESILKVKEMPFSVREVLQLTPNHYVSFSKNLFFKVDPFSYRIFVYDYHLNLVDSISRSIEWQTIPTKTLNEYKRERDSLLLTGRKVLSCSTIDFSLAPSFYHKWDKIVGIFSANDSTFVVIYQKKTNCNSDLAKELFKPEENYIPYFYDVWQKINSYGKFRLIQGDLEEYLPSANTISNKSNFPFNLDAFMQGISISDSIAAIWYHEPSPFGYKYSKLRSRLISKVMKLAFLDEIVEKPNLYVYHVYGLLPFDKERKKN